MINQRAPVNLNSSESKNTSFSAQNRTKIIQRLINTFLNFILMETKVKGLLNCLKVYKLAV